MPGKRTGRSESEPIATATTGGSREAITAPANKGVRILNARGKVPSAFENSEKIDYVMFFCLLFYQVVQSSLNCFAQCSWVFLSNMLYLSRASTRLLLSTSQSRSSDIIYELYEW